MKKESLFERLPVEVRGAITFALLPVLLPATVVSFVVAANTWSPAGNGRKKQLLFQFTKGFPRVGQPLEVEVVWLRWQSQFGSACHGSGGWKYRVDPIELLSAQCVSLCRPLAHGDAGAATVEFPHEPHWGKGAKGLCLSLDTIAAGRALLTVTARSGLRLLRDSIEIRVERPADEIHVAAHSSETEIARKRRFFTPSDGAQLASTEGMPLPLPGPMRFVVPGPHTPYPAATRLVALATAGGAPTYIAVQATLVRGPFVLQRDPDYAALKGTCPTQEMICGTTFSLVPTQAGEGLLRLQAGDLIRDITLIAS